jgi:hypothetical protein
VGGNVVRTPALALLLAALLRADALPQIDWAAGWEAAFEDAARSHRPVMVCVNSRDGESANEFAATHIYRDPRFVSASRKFVMVLVSTLDHVASGPCPRFGNVTCKQHLDGWHGLHAALGNPAEMISPQHAWFSHDGRLLRRKEYALGRQELLKVMKAVLAEVGQGAAGEDAADREARMAAEKKLLDPDPAVRSASAVALEDLGAKESIPVLMKRARREEDTTVRKNLYRALGVCGGASGDKGAAKALLDAATGDTQKVVRKHAALALRAYEGEHALVVRKRVEQAAAAAKDPEVRRAFVYVLAYVGDGKTTIPVLERIEGAESDETGRALVRCAIARLKGGEDKFGDAATRLFADDGTDPARSG